MNTLVYPLNLGTSAPPVEPEARSVDTLPLRLLRDELAIDAAIGEVAGATDMLVRLVGIVVAGFAAHAVTVAGISWPALGPGAALALGGAWLLASTGGFFAAICAGLPSYWFYGVVADVQAPAWRLAVELVRVQAVGAVVLLGALPFWLAGSLGLHLLGVDVSHSPGWMGLTYGLPFLAALPGVFGLYRTFMRMRVAAGESSRTPAFVLTVWWIVLFNFTAPLAIWSLFTALG